MILVKLSEILGRKKLKISNVITDTGVTRPTLTSLYYGNSRGINFDTLNSLCKYLGITPGELLIFYDLDILNIDVTFDQDVSIDDLQLDMEGNGFEIISRADFSGSIDIEKQKKETFTFSGILSSAAFSEKTAHDYDLSLNIDLPRAEYMAIPNEIQETIESNIIENILDKFSEFDPGASITSEDITFSDH